MRSAVRSAAFMPGASGPPVSRAMRPRSANSCFGSARVIVFSNSSESRKLRPRSANAWSKWPCSISVLIAWLLATISVSGVALGCVVDQPDHGRRGIRAGEVFDRRLAQPRSEDPVERCRRAAALHVAQHGDTRFEAGAILQDLGDCLSLDGQAIAVPGAFSE